MNPILKEFNKKYKAIIQHYLWGYCNLQTMYEAIEIYDKYLGK